MSMLNRLSTIGGVDPLPTALGRAVRSPVVQSAVEPKRVAPGLLHGPDGKLFTDLPVPPGRPSLPKLAPQQPELNLNPPGSGEVFSFASPTAGVRSAAEPNSEEYINAVRAIRTRRGDTWELGSPSLYPGDLLTKAELEVVRWALPHRQLVAQSTCGIFSFRLLLRVEVGDTVPQELVQDGLVSPTTACYCSATGVPGHAKRIA